MARPAASIKVTNKGALILIATPLGRFLNGKHNSRELVAAVCPEQGFVMKNLVNHLKRDFERRRSADELP